MYRHLCLLLNDVLFFLSLFKKNYNNNTCILKRGAQTQRTGVKYVVVDMMYMKQYLLLQLLLLLLCITISFQSKKIKNLLFGSEKLTLQNNLLLFDKIHSYIKTTHRFK